ncbi:hypothetical protein ACFQY0_17725 [Haloferula chungangensis]|uniref:DUF3619 family protein n=1 Tax=Haloferula chungangensis TaxID=1048331 RepID=A0ABW2LBJ6_9BACT
MNPSHDPDAFERCLKEIPLTRLPDVLRDEILNNACPGHSRFAIRALWQSSPKPLVVGIAAAWMLIIALQLSKPESSTTIVDSKRDAIPANEENTRAFIAWVERSQFHLEQP